MIPDIAVLEALVRRFQENPLWATAQPLDQYLRRSAAELLQAYREREAWRKVMGEQLDRHIAIASNGDASPRRRKAASAAVQVLQDLEAAVGAALVAQHSVEHAAANQTQAADSVSEPGRVGGRRDAMSVPRAGRATRRRP